MHVMLDSSKKSGSCIKLAKDRVVHSAMFPPDNLVLWKRYVTASSTSATMAALHHCPVCQR